MASIDRDSPEVGLDRVPVAAFGHTHWSRIHRLGAPGSEDPVTRRSWEDAWLYLWQTFRPAMLSTVRRTISRIGGGVVTIGDADDIVQSFLLACLEHDYLSRANSGIGKFRTFVAVCLRRHAVKYVEYHRRKRRAPSSRPLSLSDAEIDALDPGAHHEWDAALEEEWMTCLLEATLPRVRQRSARNEQLLRILQTNPSISVEDMALRLEVEPRQIPLRLHRARKMFAEEFWEVVKQSVSSPEELEEERARLSGALSHYLAASDAPSLFR